MLSRLPEECIKRAVEECRSRAIERAAIERAETDTPVQMPFLISRDTQRIKKMKAAEAFVIWRQEKHGPLSPKETELLKRGRMPRGWFVEYVRAHPPLQRPCCWPSQVKLTTKAYRRIFKLYSSALRSFFSTESAVAEVTERAVAEYDADDYFARFKYNMPRVGSQYFSSNTGFQRDWKRRRARGGGRHHTCGVLREMLVTWYSVIRHSVNVKIMCRFPKKVLLVKALMLQQDYYCSCLKNNIEPERVQVNWAQESTRPV